MEWESFRRLLPLLVFGAILAFNFIGPWLRQRRKRRREAAAAAKRSRLTPAPTPAVVSARLQRVAEALSSRVAREQSLEPLSSPSTRNLRRHRLTRAMLSDRHSLRQAIVASVILGPCRANRPQDPGV